MLEPNRKITDTYELEKKLKQKVLDNNMPTHENGESFNVESIKTRIISLKQQLRVLKIKSIHLELPPTSNKKIIGWLIVLIKKIILKMTRFIVRPIRDQQTEVNRLMIRVIEEDLGIMQAMLKKIEEGSSNNED